ncbi:MAG: hypothetical protein H7Y38_16350 [Armatimonadetes bacterium]|nr:hypothetical protein [Armatimonadota bacterium]
MQNRFVKKVKTKTGEFVILIETGKVDLKRLPWDRPYSVPGIIHGRMVYGAMPPTESQRDTIRSVIKRFEVRFNGRLIPIDEKYWKYIFMDAKIESYGPLGDFAGNFLCMYDRYSDIILILLTGGDGGCGFGVAMHISPKGLQGFFEEEPV